MPNCFPQMTKILSCFHEYLYILFPLLCMYRVLLLQSTKPVVLIDMYEKKYVGTKQDHKDSSTYLQINEKNPQSSVAH